MKIFIISDTHSEIIKKPKEYDWCFHLGDCIDAIHKGGQNYEKSIDIFRIYDYQVIGNHENMFLNELSRKCFGLNLPEENESDFKTWLKNQKMQIVKHEKIAGRIFRFSHYLQSDYNFVAGNILSSAEEFELMNYIAEKKEADIVLWGHTHKQFYQIINNVHFINPGYGKIGEYAEIIILNDNITVNLILK
ncbi:MAG TPA: metallophosphoesterase family protein [bacterium]|nr:metallophosphoesterase family protein [bacterium]